MARPISHERRRQVALAAFDAIRQRGSYGMTMSELAQALGMKRSTLYWYFRDMGHVFETVLDHVLERQRTFLADRLSAAAPPAAPGRTPSGSPHRPPHPPLHPIDLLWSYAQGIWDFFESEGPYLLALVSFWGHSEGGEPGRVVEVTNRHFLPLVEAAVAQLQAGVERGVVAPCDARAVVNLVAALIDGALVHRVTRGMPIAPVATLLWESVLLPLKRDPGAQS